MNIELPLYERGKDDEEDDYLLRSPSKSKPLQPAGMTNNISNKLDKAFKFVRNVRSNGLIVLCLTFSCALFTIFIVRYASWWLSEIDKATYIWQITTLSPQIQPPKRHSCNFNRSADDMAISKHLSPRKLSIGMVYVYGKSDSNSSWSESFINRTLENRLKYCELYGYSLLGGNDFIDSSRPIAWSKILAIRHYLPLYDYILYIDMDTVIMNFHIRLEEFITSSADIIITSDWNGPNTGVFLIRNSSWSMWFLKEAYDQKQLVPRKSSNGKRHLFKYEQRAFHYLMQTSQWTNSDLPVYPGNSSDICKHFHFLPQCAFNSYLLHPLSIREDRINIQYSPGDFLIHFAGHRGGKKAHLMSFYLAQVEREHSYGSGIPTYDSDSDSDGDEDR